MVTEFSGPPSSASTQLALGITARATLRNRMRVHYVLGGGGTPWVLLKRLKLQNNQDACDLFKNALRTVVGHIM